ncbi:ribose-phosphate pyrophosphokinase [Mycoemilia scoparia]|uniref:ribose-phosphate diphosphokinase n=1 Tax=Mycoemilia scoparia TaxID=417184 RepID=A0A9W8A0X1_9FUNG|nr:ribose-phosphate pyrophosphokinase [Mycoemilia scoparia]
MRNLSIVCGSSHKELGAKIAEILGVHTAECKLGKFSNQESSVEIKHSVRDKHVYLIQSGCGHVNDNLIELLILIQACRMGSAKKISVVLPLFPYSRQSDRLQKKRLMTTTHSNNASTSSVQSPTSLTNGDATSSKLNGNAHEKLNGLASPPTNGTSIVSGGRYMFHSTSHDSGYKQWCARPGTLVARLIQEAGANHLITMDLHHPQYQSFFDIPLDQIYAEPCIIRFIRSEISFWRSAIVVSPDAGGAKRATSVANQLGLEFALIHREHRDNDSECTGLVGEVTNRPVIIIDDLIDTADTVCMAANILKHHGATRICAIATHGIFSKNAMENLNNSPIEMIACTNTVPQEEFRAQCPVLKTIDISGILAEAVRRTFFGESLSHLFIHEKLF